MQIEATLTYEELERLSGGWLPVFGVPIDAPVLAFYPGAAAYRWHAVEVCAIEHASGGGYYVDVDLGDDEPGVGLEVFELLAPHSSRGHPDRAEWNAWSWRQGLVKAAGLTPVAWEPPGSPYRGDRPRTAELTICSVVILFTTKE